MVPVEAPCQVPVTSTYSSCRHAGASPVTVGFYELLCDVEVVNTERAMVIKDTRDTKKSKDSSATITPVGGRESAWSDLV